MKNHYNLAVAGATGLVGEAMIDILAEREFPVGTLHALASPRSAGKTILFNGKRVIVKDLAEFDFADIDIALFSAGASVSESHAPRAADAGCVVIDNTSRFRNEPDIPLVVPEVNAAALAEATGLPRTRTRKIISGSEPMLLDEFMAIGVALAFPSNQGPTVPTGYIVSSFKRLSD